MKNILLPLIIAVSVVAGIFLGVVIDRNRTQANLEQFVAATSSSPSDKLSYTLSLINGLYVDPVDVDSLIEEVIPELISRLDPHSVYIPASDMAAANETLDGEFDGIGVMFNMSTDTVVVLNVIPRGPSDKAGVQNGDRIIRIDDSLVAGQKLPQDGVVKMLRGRRGTKVRLSLERQGVSSLVPVVVERGIIPIKSLDAAFMLTPDIAFVRLSAFSKTSYKELNEALGKLREEGMKKVILDLRGNSGGFLDQAIAIANLFLPQGDLIVYTEDRNKQQVKEYSTGKGGFTDVGLVVLIDESSASSSEILAGAIQDNDRGTVVGRRSFGKGLVQRQIPYGDGSALRLTIARYYTPTGRSIQKPYDRGAAEAYNMDLFNRFAHSEMFSADSIHLADSLKFRTPGGKIVYGGGGIMPDIFVPLDTTGYTAWFREVTGKNILYRYTLDYTDRHRKEMNRISSLSELQELLDADTRLVEDFVDYAARNGVKPDWKQIETSRPLIEAELRAYIGRNTLLDYTGFYANIYVIDPAILRSIDYLNNESEQ